MNTEIDENKYAEFLMNHADVVIPDGDTLTELMESGYMLEEFLENL
jgi:hypothetical protein